MRYPCAAGGGLGHAACLCYCFNMNVIACPSIRAVMEKMYRMANSVCPALFRICIPPHYVVLLSVFSETLPANFSESLSRTNTFVSSRPCCYRLSPHHSRLGHVAASRYASVEVYGRERSFQICRVMITARFSAHWIIGSLRWFWPDGQHQIRSSVKLIQFLSNVTVAVVWGHGWSSNSNNWQVNGNHNKYVKSLQLILWRPGFNKRAISEKSCVWKAIWKSITAIRNSLKNRLILIDNSLKNNEQNEGAGNWNRIFWVVLAFFILGTITIWNEKMEMNIWSRGIWKCFYCRSLKILFPVPTPQLTYDRKARPGYDRYDRKSNGYSSESHVSVNSVVRLSVFRSILGFLS